MERNAADTTRKLSERRVTGYGLGKIRERCGYSAREFAEYLAATGARITTARSVYRLQERRTVPPRYVDALREFVGKQNFDVCFREMMAEEEERRRRYEER